MSPAVNEKEDVCDKTAPLPPCPIPEDHVDDEEDSTKVGKQGSGKDSTKMGRQHIGLRNGH